MALLTGSKEVVSIRRLCSDKEASWCAVAISTAVALLPCIASAQTNAEAARRLLMEQAVQAASTNDHTRALDLAERALHMRATPSLRRFVAEQHLALHHPREALTSAELCANEAAVSSDRDDRRLHLPACDQLRAQARAQVGLVRIPRPAGTLPTIQVNGEPLPELLLDTDYPVNPGEVVVTARQAEFQPFEQRVTVTAGQRVDVRIALTPVVHEPPKVLPPVGPAPIILLAVGGASLLVSGVLLGARIGAVGNCALEPTVIACPTQDDANRASSAPALHWAATGTFFGGVALATAGLVWLVVDRANARPVPMRAMVRPFVSPNAFGLAGTF